MDNLESSANTDIATPQTPPDVEQKAGDDMVPVPESMAESLKVGDEVMGTVVDVGGALQIQIKPMQPAAEYTGMAPGDSEMNADEALAKYMKGNKKTQ